MWPFAAAFVGDNSAKSPHTRVRKRRRYTVLCLRVNVCVLCKQIIIMFACQVGTKYMGCSAHAHSCSGAALMPRVAFRLCARVHHFNGMLLGREVCANACAKYTHTQTHIFYTSCANKPNRQARENRGGNILYYCAVMWYCIHVNTGIHHHVQNMPARGDRAGFFFGAVVTLILVCEMRCVRQTLSNGESDASVGLY